MQGSPRLSAPPPENQQSYEFSRLGWWVGGATSLLGAGNTTSINTIDATKNKPGAQAGLVYRTTTPQLET
jgi:hypothetical protein